MHVTFRSNKNFTQVRYVSTATVQRERNPKGFVGVVDNQTDKVQISIAC